MSQIYSFNIICMNNFNTYDYEFLTKCLQQGSIAFKSESLKRLTTLAQNDKKQFSLNSKIILMSIQQLYTQEKEDLNILVTFVLSEIILGCISKQNEQIIKAKHLKHLINNLGHLTKTSLRKSSHTCLLAFVKSYHNFDGLIEQYLNHGFQNESVLIKQKSINSFQSIFILEVKYMNWETDQSRMLLQSLVAKAGDENLQIAKAAAQCLLSLCKNQGIKICASLLSIGYLQKMHDFLQTTYQKIPTIDLAVSYIDIKEMMENLRNKPKVAVEKSPVVNPEQKKQSKTIQISNTSTSLTYQRRLEKIKKSINHENEVIKKAEKDSNNLGFLKLLGSLSNEGNLKQRTEAVQEILFKIKSHKNKPEFESSIKAALPNILKLLKDSNPKIVSLTLRIIENIVHQLKPTDPQLQNLIVAIIQKLGDQKISIRQIVSKVIKQLINKTGDKGIWVKELLENLGKNNNTFLKDETLNLISGIYEDNQIGEINYPIDTLLEKIAPMTDDPKTKIKIRTIDCLSQIVFKSGQISRHNQMLKKQMTDIFYQMYVEKVNKLIQDKERKALQEADRKRKTDEMSSYRTTYQQRSGHYSRQKQTNGEDLNVSMDVVKKRVSQLKRRRNLLSTQETSSLDGRTPRRQSRQRTIQQTSNVSNVNMQEVDIMLPSLYKKSRTNRFMLTKRFQGNNTLSPTKESHSTSKNQTYLSKNDLKPLNDPEKQFKNILTDLKSNDWKTQFETTNKLRRLIQFNPEIILSTSSANLHSIILESIGLIQCLRSSVSKNGLICLNQLILALGKQVDPEMEIILEKLMKKSADTNVFISSQVQKCLKNLSINATSSKVIEKLSAFKDSKNFAIKDAYISALIDMKNEEKIRSKQYGKLVESMALFLNEGQLDLRAKAKNGIMQICSSLGDWYRALRGKINSASFKLVCDLMTKSQTGSLSAQMSPPKTRKQVLAPQLRTISIEKNTEQKIELKKQTPSAKKSFIKVSQFPAEFNQIQNLIEISSSSEWKKRIQASRGLRLLALKYPDEFIQYRASCHFIDILSKQIIEPNVKVSVNAMQIFSEILTPLRRLVENSMSVVCNSIFSSLSSNKIEIKQMAEKCTHQLIQQSQVSQILQHLCHGIMYSLPKSRIFLLNKLQDLTPKIYQQRKQLLFKHVFPILNKLMEQFKAQIMPHVVNQFSILYEIMGNNMFSHVTKFKQVRELIAK